MQSKDFFILKIFLSFLTLFGLGNQYLSQNIHIDRFGMQQGLPQSQINDLLFDSRGMIWVGTGGGGIAFFDGKSFHVLEEKNGLAGNITLGIMEDAQNRILVCSTWGGISVIENNKVSKIINYKEGEGYVNHLITDNYGRTWAIGQRLYYIEDDKLVESKVTNTFLQDFSQIHCDGDLLYVSNGHQLYGVNVLTQDIEFSREFDFAITAIETLNNGDLLLASSGKGVYVVGENHQDKVSFDISGNNSLIGQVIYKESNAKYWIGTDEGVFIFEDGVIKTYGESKMGNFDVTDVFKDPQGNLWFGTKGMGLVSEVKTPFDYFSNVEGLNASDNFPIFKDHKDRLWVGNNEKGLYVYDGATVIHLTMDHGLPNNKIRVLKGDSKGVWIGTGEGLAFVDYSFKVTTFKEFEGTYVKTIEQSHLGELFIGTIGNGVWKMNGDSFIRLNEYSDKNIHSIGFWNHKLLLGTPNGLVYLNGGVEERIMNEFSNSFIGNIAVGNGDYIWVGTDNSVSSFNFKTKEVTNFSSENTDLSSDLVYQLFFDQNGFLWVGTNSGVHKLTIDNQGKINKVKNYGYTEGFKGVETNAKGYFVSESEIYFSTIEGIHKYVPERDYNSGYNTPINITGVRLFFENFSLSKYAGSDEKNWYDVPESLTFNNDENHLKFEFQALDYSKTENLKYTYILEGFDKSWSPPTENGEAIYSNLLPGRYVFKVREYNNEFSEIAELKIKIESPLPPFYKTTWFVLLILIGMIVMVYYFTEYRTKKLRNQQLYLESKIEERTQEILESEKEKTVLLQEVHHRVKNNLQIIISLFRLQTYFTDNEEAIELFTNSQNRIRSMSKIHEKLYETKDLSKIEIKSYIEELYRDIVSSYDINNKVTILTDVQSCELNLDQLTPFALILNEIVTNSMKYGIKELSNPEIGVQLRQTVIGDTIITMWDNGSGYDEDLWENHNSMGIELIKTLTEQLDGKIKREHINGRFQYVLNFRAQKA